MIDNAFELVTQTMERQYPDHVAFRYVAADGETVVEKDLCPVCAGHPPCGDLSARCHP